jgi:hypothetical protein
MILVKGEGNTKRSKLQLEVGDGPSYLGKLKVALQFGPAISSVSSVHRADTA